MDTVPLNLQSSFAYVVFSCNAYVFGTNEVGLGVGVRTGSAPYTVVLQMCNGVVSCGCSERSR